MINPISFGSLKTNKKTCEKMMREFRREYPFMISSDTFYKTKINQHSGKTESDMNLYNKCLQLVRKSGFRIDSVRKESSGTFLNWDELIQTLSRTVKTYKAGNCGEQSLLLTDRFVKSGIESPALHRVLMNIYKDKNNRYANHTFLVFGMKNDAQISNPATWGNETVIVDPWANIILPHREAIEYYKKLFNISLEDTAIDFEYNDLIDVKAEVIKNRLKR